MDFNSRRMSRELPRSTAQSSVGGSSVVDQSAHALCSLCEKILSPDNETAGDLENIGICGDCKFLFLEDLDTPLHVSRRRRPPSRRRTRNSSSESTENLFSQQFSHMINLVRQNQSTGFGPEDPTVEADPASSVFQRTSTRTTPRGSRRWRRVLSDTESDGFDNMDFLYGETESNVSFGRHRVFHGESDAISFSTYGGDSDASVDLHGFLDSEMFNQPNDGSDFESDTDIDPMHAGLNHWNSDDQGGEGAEEEEEEGEEEEDGEWEEGDAEEDVIQPADARDRVQDFLFRSQGGQRSHSPEFDMMRTREIFANMEEQVWGPDFGYPADYLDGRGLEDFLQHIAEDDNSRRGAPPAAVSFVNSLPRIVISKEHEKHDGLACAICKDVLTVGTEVNRLPCDHLYHPFCILPWLSSRNSCPLCRYELPTDDKDYEKGKRNVRSSVEIRRDIHQNVTEDSSVTFSDREDEEEEREFSEGRLDHRALIGEDPVISSSERGSGRGRWFFLAAAPIVSLVGIVLVLWMRNVGTERRGPSRPSIPPEQVRQQHVPISGSSSNWRESRGRRWWSLF